MNCISVLSMVTPTESFQTLYGITTDKKTGMYVLIYCESACCNYPEFDIDDDPAGVARTWDLSDQSIMKRQFPTSRPFRKVKVTSGSREGSKKRAQ